MARDPDTIQREIERSRDALAASLDVLTARVNPKKLADDGRQAAAAKLADPKIKYALIGVGCWSSPRWCAASSAEAAGGRGRDAADTRTSAVSPC